MEVFPLLDSAVTRTSTGVGGSMTRWGVLWSRKEVTLEMSLGPGGRQASVGGGGKGETQPIQEAFKEREWASPGVGGGEVW